MTDDGDSSLPDMFVSHSLYEGTELVELLAVDAVRHQGVGQTELLGGGLAIVIPLVRHVEDVLQAGVGAEQLLVEGETDLVLVLLQQRSANLEDLTCGTAQSHSQVYNHIMLSSRSGENESRHIL